MKKFVLCLLLCYKSPECGARTRQRICGPHDSLITIRECARACVCVYVSVEDEGISVCQSRTQTSLNKNISLSSTFCCKNTAQHTNSKIKLKKTAYIITERKEKKTQTVN